MKKNRKLLIAGGLVAAVAASGGAFTAGVNTDADQSDVAAAGNVTVDGAQVLDVDYTITGTNLDAVVVTFDDIYAIEGTDFRLSVDGTPLSFSSSTLLEQGGVDDDADTEGDATQVTFTATGVSVATIASTDIVVTSENIPTDDNDSTVV